MAPTASGVYNESPFAHVHRTRDWLLLDLAQTPDERFNIIPDLKAARVPALPCCPDLLHERNPPRPDLRDPRPGRVWRAGVAGSALFDADHRGHDGDPLRHQRLDTVLRIYVGDEPHRAILSGTIRRGQVSRIRSAILFADMRDYTRPDRHPVA